MIQEAGIPIWVMEPLRGGRLAKASGELAAIMQSLRPTETVPGWAFRFLQSIPGVTVVLSGMSNLEQLKANIATWKTDEPLNKEEFDAVVKYADEETKKGGLPCTACHYCTSHCPKGLPIPELIALYNEHKITGGGFIAPMAVGSMPEEKRPASFDSYEYAEKVLEAMYNKANHSIGIIDIHNIEKKEEFIQFRKGLYQDYEERYQDLPQFFMRKNRHS